MKRRPWFLFALALCVLGLIAVGWLGYTLLTTPDPADVPSAQQHGDEPSPSPVPWNLPGGPPPGAPGLGSTDGKGPGGGAAAQAGSGHAGAHVGGPAAVDVPPLPGQPLQLSIPDLGLNVHVYAAQLGASREFYPPTVPDAFWMMDYGTAGPRSTNTLYIAGHTSRDLAAAFNPLLDPADERGRAAVGQKIQITTPEAVYTYAVTSAERYDKRSVMLQSRLWENAPGRLALVTCFQHDHNAVSDQNYVIYAELQR